MVEKGTSNTQVEDYMRDIIYSYPGVCGRMNTRKNTRQFKSDSDFKFCHQRMNNNLPVALVLISSH